MGMYEIEEGSKFDEVADRIMADLEPDDDQGERTANPRGGG